MTPSQRTAGALFILAIGSACYAPTPKKSRDDCLSNETAWRCKGAFECTCTKNVTPLPALVFCARYAAPPLPLDAEAERIATTAYSSKIAVGEVLHVACDDLGTRTLPPQSIEADGVELGPAPAPESEPQAWGDAKCSACVSAHCGPEAWACWNEVTVCRCLDACQHGATEADYVADLATCGCAAPNSAVYETFRACSVAACYEACWPADECICP